MDLETFLWKYKLTGREFARKIGCSYSTMHSYVSRRRKPKLIMATKIEKYSRGEVTAAELMTGRYTTDLKDDFITYPKHCKGDDREEIATNNKICL